MAITVDELFNEAIHLPIDVQAILAEKLVFNIESHIDPALEKMHVELAKKRRDEVRAGLVGTVDGKAALQKVRARIGS